MCLEKLAFLIAHTVERYFVEKYFKNVKGTSFKTNEHVYFNKILYLFGCRITTINKTCQLFFEIKNKFHVDTFLTL